LKSDPKTSALSRSYYGKNQSYGSLTDHTVVRQGLKALLEAEPDITIVGEAEMDGSFAACLENYCPTWW